MRDVKFRGYSRALNRWVCGSLLRGVEYDFATGEEVLYIMENTKGLGKGLRFLNDCIHKVETASVGEYIGLMDINYANIYTGDLLEMIARNGQRFEVEVIFNQKLKIFWLKGEKMSCGIRVIPSSFRVIGNVFDTEKKLIEH